MVSTFLCSLRPGPAAAGLLGSLSLNGVVIVAHEKKTIVVEQVCWGDGAGAVEAWVLWGGGAFGVPQRGAAYQPGVKPRVRYTTGAF